MKGLLPQSCLSVIASLSWRFGLIHLAHDWRRLDLVSSFAFWGQGGHCTAHKERRPRGEAYWYAYVGVGKKLAKNIWIGRLS
jgi:hypothetical protein